jgi:Ca2+-binding RTX toxin-like protein
LEVNGDIGTQDTLTLNDQDSAAGKEFTVNAEYLSWVGGPTISYGTVESLTLNAGNHDDTFRVQSTAAAAPPVLNAGGGNDTIHAGSASGTLDALLGAVTVHGDGHTSGDALIVHDELTAGGKTYTLTANQVTRLGGGPPIAISYDTVESLSLNAGVGDDSIFVRATAAGTPVTVNATFGNDALHVGSFANTLDTILGAVTVQGGPHLVSDSLTIHDEGSAAGHTYTVTDTQVVRLGGPTVSYGTVESLVLNAGSAIDTVNVYSVGTPPVTINAGDQDDTIVVGHPANGLLEVLGPVIVNGQGGTDLLHVDDYTSVGAYYTITPTTVDRQASDPITYAEVEVLEVNVSNGSNEVTVEGLAPGTPTTITAHDSDDVIRIHSTPANTPLTVYAGDGDDHVELHDASSLPNTLLDGIQGGVTVHGQGHNTPLGDGLELRDDGNVADHIYTFTATQILRTGMATVTYDGMETVGLEGGLGNDTYDVHSTAGVWNVVASSGGSDVYVVGGPNHTLAALPGTLNIAEFGNDMDWLILNDQGNSVAQTYAVTDTEVNGTNPHFVILYKAFWPGTVENVVLNAASGGNTFLVHSLSAATALTLNAGANSDTLTMLPGSLAGTLTVDGQGGTNTLDYTAYSTDVMVNLPLGTATDIAYGISNIHNVAGGAGHDILVGDLLANMLRGGIGRDLLIGGLGADRLDGGDDDDLLFDGTTAYDNDPTTLQNIRSVWADPALLYPDRVEAIRTAYLDPLAVTSDGDADQLLGLGGLDWFWADLALDVSDWDQQTEYWG